MSDISIADDYEFPFEVRDAGDYGFGCFATRDIKPGEIVLVDSSSIIIAEGEVHETCDQLVRCYESLDEEDQEEWRSLSGHLRENRLEMYRWSYRRKRPDGTPLFKEEPEFYAILHSQFDSNSFDIDNTNLTALYLLASRFNHSCDPNVVYENELVIGRWVGRASRNIAEGEQLFIAYLAIHAPVAQRQAKSQQWGFNCACDKCLEKKDLYTSALEDARDIANNVEVEWAKPLSLHTNDVHNLEERLARRVDLLRQANDKQNEADKEKDKSPQKELIFALWDLAWFHEHYYINRRREGKKEDFLRHLESALDNVRQAALLAMRIWPRTHSVVLMLTKDIRKWQNTWDNRDTPPLGLAG
ncbi:hypothetical protein F4803DRAFT_568418 [Xylaria telfairii]|nr:hypothetical protein F4803DRAFT_568418 [Xylaria telfairii]